LQNVIQGFIRLFDYSFDPCTGVTSRACTIGDLKPIRTGSVHI
jgi:hypothetical protein